MPVELDAMVAAALGEQRSQLVELVRRAVDAELVLVELVAEELTVRANGSAPAAPPELPAEERAPAADDPAPVVAAEHPSPAATKTCRACGQTRPLDQFDQTRRGRRRAECRPCRRAHDREHRSSPPRPDVIERA